MGLGSSHKPVHRNLADKAKVKCPFIRGRVTWNAADVSPSVEILRPQDGTQVGDEGFDDEMQMGFADVQVLGRANDSEDGALGGDSLIWTTDRTDLQDEFLGFGESLPLRLFTGDICSQRAGTHEITLTATDSAGNVSADSITVIVRRQVC